MTDLLLGLGLVSVGIGLGVWVTQWRRRRFNAIAPFSDRWRSEHAYDKDGEP